MSATIIDGKKLAAATRAEIAAGVAALKAEKGVTPGLAVILVGDNPASVSYVTAKEKASREAGMHSLEIRLPADATEDEVLERVRALNADPAIHGILVQLPLPKGISEKKVIYAIAPEKDVDGFTPVNVGKMLIGDDCFLPCTPHGIVKLIETAGMDISGKHAVVIGRSNIVGKPVANRVPDATKPKGYRLCGDADFDSCAAVASAITPVPGGVGPMTITMLLWNTLQAARNSARAC